MGCSRFTPTPNPVGRASDARHRRCLLRCLAHDRRAPVPRFLNPLLRFGFNAQLMFMQGLRWMLPLREGPGSAVVLILRLRQDHLLTGSPATDSAASAAVQPL